MVSSYSRVMSQVNWSKLTNEILGLCSENQEFGVPLSVV